MARPLSDKVVATPIDAPDFGLKIIPGTQLPTDPVCQNAPKESTKQKTFCIKIPDDTLHRSWWQDQYIEQLVSQGWDSIGPVNREQPPFPQQSNSPADMKFLTGKYENGCRSTLVSFVIYDGDYRQFQKNLTEPVRKLNATYLIFLEASNNCRN